MPVGPASAKGSMAGPVSRGSRTATGDGPPKADPVAAPGTASGHGRPARVAVISWLRPPDRGRWLTAEKPAAVSMDRSSAVAGR